MIYLRMHSTHFVYSYMESDMVKDHLDSERKNLLPPVHNYLIYSKGFYMCYPTNRIGYTMAIVMPVVEHWLKQEIVQWVPYEWMFYHGPTSRSIVLDMATQICLRNCMSLRHLYH